MELSFDAEKFIALVKPRETIWNYKSHVYNDKEQRRNEWMAVCKEMVPNFEEKTSSAQHAIVTSFQRQWKVLRDGFLRSLKNIKVRGPTAKPYTYHNDLLFMSELYDQDIEKNMKQKRGDSSDRTSEADTVPSPDVVPIVKRRAKRKAQRQVSMTTEIIEPKAPSPTPEEALIEKITNYIENEERAKQNNDHDEDKLFLLSLLSDFKSVPEEHKLDAKFDIINVLRHYRNLGGMSRASGSKRSRKSANQRALSTTANKTTEFCYVKCEDDDSEED